MFLASAARATSAWSLPIEQAVVAGWAADRLGYAFALGYRAALHALIPDLSPALPAVLCATEQGGAHPRAVATRLVQHGPGWQLDGRKRWSTLADRAEVLLVLATTGEQDGQSQLRLVRVAGDARGVSRIPMPATPFTPEIPHFEVCFEGVYVPESALLPGEAWSTYVRPFRTVEDLHVTAAAMSYLLRLAVDADWPEAARAELVHLIRASQALAPADPRAPETEIAVAGLLEGFRRWLAGTEPHWALVADEVQGRWRRDRPLLEIAQGLRGRRLAAAFERCGTMDP